MRMCRYHVDKRCYHSSCSLIDEFGNVSACSLHPNPEGFFRRRKVVTVRVSIFCRGFRRGEGGC